MAQPSGFIPRQWTGGQTTDRKPGARQRYQLAESAKLRSLLAMLPTKSSNPLNLRSSAGLVLRAVAESR